MNCRVICFCRRREREELTKVKQDLLFLWNLHYQYYAYCILHTPFINIAISISILASVIVLIKGKVRLVEQLLGSWQLCTRASSPYWQSQFQFHQQVELLSSQLGHNKLNIKANCQWFGSQRNEEKRKAYFGYWHLPNSSINPNPIRSSPIITSQKSGHWPFICRNNAWIYMLAFV